MSLYTSLYPEERGLGLLQSTILLRAVQNYLAVISDKHNLIAQVYSAGNEMHLLLHPTALHLRLRLHSTVSRARISYKLRDQHDSLCLDISYLRPSVDKAWPEKIAATRQRHMAPLESGHGGAAEI